MEVITESLQFSSEKENQTTFSTTELQTMSSTMLPVENLTLLEVFAESFNQSIYNSSTEFYNGSLTDSDTSTTTISTVTSTLVSIIEDTLQQYFNQSTSSTTQIPEINVTTPSPTTTTTNNIVSISNEVISTTLSTAVATTLGTTTTVGSPTDTIFNNVIPYLNNTWNLNNRTDTTIFNQYTNNSGSDLDIPMMSTTNAVLTILPLVLITLVIILGNLLVVIAVFTRKSLRSPQNIYIVSLAITDMAVAVLILPYNITTLVLRKWIFGEIICKLYLTVDVSICTGSIFHLCAIGIDRYRAITDGVNYVQKRNLKSVLWTILSLWTIAIWIGSPPFLAVNDWKIKYNGHSCEMPDSPGYNIHLAIGALFFPLVIMSYIYAKIYYAIRERLRDRARVTCVELTSDADTTDKLDSTTDVESSNTIGTLGRQNGKRKPSAQISAFLVNKQRFSLSRERKAAKTLGIIMAAFIFCWLPLGFLNVISSLCPNHLKPSETIFHIFTWLGYINSGLNPIIYGVSNQEFQKAFKRILHLHR